MKSRFLKIVGPTFILKQNWTQHFKKSCSTIFFILLLYFGRSQRRVGQPAGPAYGVGRGEEASPKARRPPRWGEQAARGGTVTQ